MMMCVCVARIMNKRTYTDASNYYHLTWKHKLKWKVYRGGEWMLRGNRIKGHTTYAPNYHKNLTKPNIFICVPTVVLLFLQQHYHSYAESKPNAMNMCTIFSDLPNTSTDTCTTYLSVRVQVHVCIKQIKVIAYKIGSYWLLNIYITLSNEKFSDIITRYVANLGEIHKNNIQLFCFGSCCCCCWKWR